MIQLKDSIREQNPIEEVIQSFIDLDKNHKALCPFHKEKTPSFSVNVKEQYFHCFGCGAGGDVFSFLMQYKNMSFKEAMLYLAEKKGIRIEREFVGFEEEEERRKIYDALKQATHSFHKELPANVRTYLNKRGITNDTIDRQKIGYCSNNMKLNMSKDVLYKAGLLYESGNPYFDGFITFPHWCYGKVVYMSGRCYWEKKHKKLEKDKVVLEHLYNEQAVYNKEVIIAEGEIDTLTLLQHGFNACGVLGARSFKEEWAQKFDACEIIYLAFDADEAGRMATLKLGEALAKKTRIVTLPDGQDVNDFFNSTNADDFQKLLKQAVSFLEYKIMNMDASTPKTRLPQKLDIILREMATYNIAESDALLKHTIKNHFSLANDEIKSYEKLLKSYRTNVVASDNVSLSQKEILDIIHTEETTTIIHPMQDFAHGTMNFGIKIKDDTAVVTSNKEVFGFSSAKEHNYVFKNSSMDVSRFSGAGLERFLRGDEVKIEHLYWTIHNYIKRFICFPATAYISYITLWIMGTYIFMIFRYYPYVWLNAEKGSGKTLLMEILAAVAFNGELVTNPTESVIFRDISNNLITMFIDEVEQLQKRDKDTYASLISLLNSGFNKSGIVKRVEMNGKKYCVKTYSAYSPKMFAGINQIHDVLQDRTVRIPILRKKEKEQVERYKETAEIIRLQKSIRDDLYIFALTYGEQIADIYYNADKNSIEGMEHLNNRELDIWEPIFLLANIIDALNNSTGITSMMESLSKASLDEKLTDSIFENETYKLLNVVKGMLDELMPIITNVNDPCVFSAKEVLEYFRGTEEFDWIERTHVLTKKLKKINITAEQRRINGVKTRIYRIRKTEFFDLCERFNV